MTTPFPTYVGGLPIASSVNPTDLVYLLQGGVSKSATAAQVGSGGLTPGGPSASIQFNNSGVFGGFGIYTAATHTLQFDAADAAAPNAQTLQAQSVIAGTLNTPGVNWTFNGSRGTGNAIAGDIIFQTGVNLASGTTQHTLAEVMRITHGATQGFSPGSVLVGITADPLFTNPSFGGGGVPAPFVVASNTGFDAANGPIFLSYNVSSGFFSPLIMAATAGLTPSSNVAVQGGITSAIYFQAANGTNYSTLGVIKAGPEAPVVSGNSPGTFAFFVTNFGSGVEREALRIEPGGIGDPEDCHISFPQGDIAGLNTLSNGASTTVTITGPATPAVVTWTNHGFVQGQIIKFTGSPPAPIATGTAYYVLLSNLTASTFEISATPSGSPVNTTGAAGGAITGTTQSNPQFATTLVTVGPSGLTGSLTQAGWAIQQTWNTTGVTAGALVVNATNIASGANSLLADFQLSGKSALRIDNNGFVLVENAPVGTFTNVNNAPVQVFCHAGDARGLSLFQYGPANNQAQLDFYFTPSSSGPTTQSLVPQGDWLGAITFNGSDGSVFQMGARILAVRNGAGGLGNTPTDLQFHTGSGATPVNRMVLDTSGNLIVGAGSVFPTAQMNGTFGSTQLVQLQGSGGGTGFMALRFDTSANPAKVIVGKSHNATVGNQGAVLVNEILGVLDFIGSDGTLLNESSYIQAICDVAPATSSTPGRLSFWTATVGASQNPLERVRLDSSGNLAVAMQGALATNATNGFLYIATCAGTPTGTPAPPNALTGQVPMVYDTTNHKFWIFDTGASAWRGVVLT